MDVSVIAGATAIALLGVIVGAKVQKAAKFIFPYDALTLTICGFCLVDCVFELFSFDKFWYLPFLLGYATGYLVVGRTSYLMIQTVSLSEKTMISDPWVMWEEDGRMYTQKQSNVALFRRLFLGVKHEVRTNAPLDDDWIVTTKIPLFPIISKPTVIAEEVVTSWTPVHVFWKFHTKQYTTEIILAYGGMVSKLQLAQDERYLQKMQQQNTDLVAAVHELRGQQGPMLMEMALRLEQKITSTAPVNRMFDLISRNPKKKKKVEKDGSSEDEAADETES